MPLKPGTYFESLGVKKALSNHMQHGLAGLWISFSYTSNSLRTWDESIVRQLRKVRAGGLSPTGRWGAWRLHFCRVLIAKWGCTLGLSWHWLGSRQWDTSHFTDPPRIFQEKACVALFWGCVISLTHIHGAHIPGAMWPGVIHSTYGWPCKRIPESSLLVQACAGHVCHQEALWSGCQTWLSTLSYPPSPCVFMAPPDFQSL